jgi:hypothetical protein
LASMIDSELRRWNSRRIGGIDADKHHIFSHC